jgi:hypothetical protein
MEGRRDRSRRGELQRMLGELGEVLPRVAHGNLEHPAQGWYARIDAGPRAGEELFLGDYSMLAGRRITELVSEVNGAKLRPARRR